VTGTGERARELPPWWVVLLVALAVAAVAFAIGRFSTFGTVVPATPDGASPEAGFARDMQVHHAQAIDMAMTVYRTTDDPEVRVLAYDIATGQSAQKGEMYDWLVQWGLPQVSTAPMAWMSGSDAGHDHGMAADEPLSDEAMREAMGMASPAELTALGEATGRGADCLFLQLMIRHHNGAVPMTDAVLELGSEPRTLAAAAAMRATQLFEIDAMESVQTRLACTD